MNDQELITPLGFRENVYPYSSIERHDVIRKIRLENELEYGDMSEKHILYCFRTKRLKGRVFTNDEVIDLEKDIDIIVQKINDSNNLKIVGYIDANPYHDLYKGERFKAVLNRIGKNGQDHVVKLFNHISCFIKSKDNPKVYNELKKEDVVLLEVIGTRFYDTQIQVWVKPLEILNR